MSTDLRQHIQQTPLCDTHEHLRKEAEWVENGPDDVLQDLFSNYVPADLVSAGATPEAMTRLQDSSDGDLAARFEGIRDAWEAIRHTGYGEAVRILGEEVYDLRQWTADEFSLAGEKLARWRQPGGRYHLLHEVANLDHCQTDDFCWPCLPDASGPEFFFYDISWAGFCGGNIDFQALESETGVAATDLPSLRRAMESIFDKYAACAIAVKAQHAYNRTLLWQERGDDEAATVLDKIATRSTDVVDLAAWETTNLVTVAGALTEAARGREETRGSHWRDDFPERDDATWAGHFDTVMSDGVAEVSFVSAVASDGGTS